MPIRVETYLKTIDQELADLAMNPYDTDEVNSFKSGAIMCLQWLRNGDMKPSVVADLYKSNHDDRAGKIN